jgi:hypothetical protein
MTETSRVQRWREGKRQHGLKAVTIWLTAEEELRLKDLALQGYCSPSAVIQRALAQFSPRTLSSISTETDMSQIRELIRAEFIAMQAEKTTVTDTVTDTVTEVVTETLERDLPALVRQLVEGLALEALGLPVADMYSDATDTEEPDLPVTDAFGDVTETEAPGLPVTDTDYGNGTDMKIPEEVEEAPARRKGGRPWSAMGQRIVALLEEHPEGLSAEQIRAFLQPEKPLGDTLQSLRKRQKVQTRGTGKELRYFVA